MSITECPNDFVADLEYDGTSVLSFSLRYIYVYSKHNWNEDAIGWLVDWFGNRNATTNSWHLSFSGHSISRIPRQMELIDNFGVLQIEDNIVPKCFN